LKLSYRISTQDSKGSSGCWNCQSGR